MLCYTIEMCMCTITLAHLLYKIKSLNNGIHSESMHLCPQSYSNVI